MGSSWYSGARRKTPGSRPRSIRMSSSSQLFWRTPFRPMALSNAKWTRVSSGDDRESRNAVSRSSGEMSRKLYLARKFEMKLYATASISCTGVCGGLASGSTACAASSGSTGAPGESAGSGGSSASASVVRLSSTAASACAVSMASAAAPRSDARFPAPFPAPPPGPFVSIVSARLW
eukprot:Amastigsp_a346879_7.p4 type:complete len:177 gc:universal Amastigsp_a346879_7:649-1179(+)